VSLSASRSKGGVGRGGLGARGDSLSLPRPPTIRTAGRPSAVDGSAGSVELLMASADGEGRESRDSQGRVF